MKVLIIEDEIEAAKNIQWLLNKVEPNATIVGTIETVVEGIMWLKNNSLPDLIISDIQLADGISFEIFIEVKIHCPVIFTTAYNEYALKAFEVHSIDYLLKPIDEKAMERAMEKFKSLKFSSYNVISDKINELFKQNTIPQRNYRQSFLVRFREKMLPIKTEKFAYFQTKEGLVYGKTFDGNSYIIDFTLEELEQQIQPQLFFRANRQFIVNREIIHEIEFYFNGRMLLKTMSISEEPILISKERVPVFKKWFEGTSSPF